MPLNISIDVDGTLLDEDGSLDTNTRAALLKLKGKGHRLQLWSTGGADYANKMAVKHKVADLFENFATKPDVAVDDIPESARPAATLKVENKFHLRNAVELLESKVEGCVEPALCPSQSLKQLVAEIQTGASEAKTRLGNLLRPGISFHPIPFFGNVESASVITIGLNPAITEFAEYRQWKSQLDAEELTFRLVNYFRLAGVQYPPPHGWFNEVTEFLHIVECPQKIAAAHIDLCPWTSIAPKRQGGFWNFVDEQMERWLARTVIHAKATVKLIIILESPKPREFERARQELAKRIIQSSLGSWAGKIRVKKKEELVAWSWKHRKDLRHFIGLSNIID